MKSIKRRRFTDKAAHWVIKLGGAAVIVVILALFIFIFLEVYPLLKDARVIDKKTFLLSESVISLKTDEQQEIACVLYKKGLVEFISLADGAVIKKHPLSGLGNALITSVDMADNHLFIGTDDGRLLTVALSFSESFDQGVRVISPEVSEEEPLCIDDQKKPLKSIICKKSDSARVLIASSEDGRLLLRATEETTSLFGRGEKKEVAQDITGLISGAGRNDAPHLSPPEDHLAKTPAVTSLALDHFLENLYVGASNGELFHFNISDKENPYLVEKIKASDTAITALGFLLGDISLVVGDQRGGINVWMRVRDEASASGWALKKIHTLKSHNASITAIAPSFRDKGFLTAASDGTINLNHATSEQTLLTITTNAKPATIVFSPKANGALAVDENNTLYLWHISNPHPETTLKTLFGRVWYEGYEKPEFVWQSTGGTDDFEPKLSLTPLIFGTIKGTMYAMLFAVPVGVLAALYTSQFLHKTLKPIKPVIEIMAALPSVVLGFLAGLWLAPLIEKIFPAIIIFPFFILVFITFAIFLWNYIPPSFKGRYKHGAEALFLIPFIIIAAYVSIRLCGYCEHLLFSDDYRRWLNDVLGLRYDQRNAVVVGFAIGFAIIPLIFTISEDAMNNVPKSLISASLALGATPWQTAVRVVLPTASPGVFSAIMIGFGRAVGETMIVLMATGNTPIMDWNIFNGFRALAANIAVEIPEAPMGGTLYRTLFLAALLLFITTFLVNTIAETVRQKMKRRYSKL
jgi:phosphate transport system permease protein